MYMALMNAMGYQFIGIGTTKEKAEKTILKEYNKQNRTKQNIGYLKDWYGMSVEEIHDGDCYMV